MDIFTPFLIISALVVAVIALARSKDNREAVESQKSQIKALLDELRLLSRRVSELEKTEKKSSSGEAAKQAAPAKEPEEAQAFDATPIAVSPKYETPAALPPPPKIPVASANPSRPVYRPSVSTAVFSTQAKRPTPDSSKVQQPRRWADMEERVGTNWLNKIGTAAFVIGVALLLNYSMHYLGPSGKIALGYVLSVIFLMAGIVGERKERYRIPARAVLGGGWALAYFTTYAMHNIAVVRIIQSRNLGFTLLFVVAVAMVTHSMRYKSEVTTGFAYLLAFVSVGVGQIPIGGLIATALLAASLAAILRTRRWFVLEPFAIVATYLLHWLWLNQIYESIGGHKPFPQFTASVALLTAYWVIFMVSYFLRDQRNAQETQLLTISFLLNSGGYLIVLHMQSFHPAWRFWFLLGAGAVYLGISAFSWRIGRRLAFILASTLGVALLLAAIPYRYSGGNLEILWIIEAEAFLIAGWRLPDPHLRGLGWAGMLLLAGYVAFYDLFERCFVWQPPNGKTGWLLLAFAAAFFLNGRFRNGLGESVTHLDEAAMLASPHVATGFALAAAWIGLSFHWVGLVWLIISMVLIEAGRRLPDRILWFCGQAAAALAVARLLVVNLQHSESWHNVSLRLITVAASCAILYFYAQRTAPVKGFDDSSWPSHEFAVKWSTFCGGLPGLYTGVASFLFAILLWNEVTSGAVAIAWGLFGLVLLEVGRTVKNRPLQVHAYLLLGASFVRVFIADLNSIDHLGPVRTPILTIGILAAIYYYVAATANELRSAFLWLGALSLIALFRFELPIQWVAVSWATLTVVFFVLGRWLKSGTLLNQSYAITLLVGARCAFDNFYEVEHWHSTTVRVVTVAACAVLLYIVFVVAQFSKQAPASGSLAAGARGDFWNWLVRIWRAVQSYPQRLFFFVPTTLLTVLLSLEVRRGFLTAAWGLEALVVFLIVLKMDERAYRWFSLLLFLLCVARIVTVDVWNLDALGRIVSFMGLGIALLAVSFLYARHREVLSKVL